MDNQTEMQDNVQKTKWVAGPFTMNRKHRRMWMSLNAARHRRIKAYTEGYRGYVSHRGQIVL